MTPIETYLRDMSQIRSTGAAVPEASYYPALSNLFNEIGKTLKPRVRCILQLANRGAGNPDGGLFTGNQFERRSDGEPVPGQMPERGVIEIKPTKDDAWVTADGEQVSKYWGKYGLVLVTNYRDFVLLGRDSAGLSVKLETYRLAEDEKSFWGIAAHPRKAAEDHGARFTEYLKRVMLHSAPLSSPADLAWFLASYARDARSRIECAELPALDAVREALEQALGLKFDGKKGDHFFRSTLIQTLFYGVFSAWVLWSKQHPPGDRTSRFDWHAAGWSLHVPMIRTLFHQVADPSRLKPLGLVEPLDWTAQALNRVDRASFFSTFDQGKAVQYFYEPFLQHFDPVLRKDLGVWYTPPEIVRYMVARVDTVLREELDIDDGLADPRVYVLDPCCGTGAFLVEVLHKIAETLRERGGDALVAQDIKLAAMKRVFGFEIMPAPFVVAHMQLGLLLQQLQAPLSDVRSERAGVYLTNALTGWEPAKGARATPPFAELEEERNAADEVKQVRPILVILGNPPYNAYAGISPDEEQGLVDPYKQGLNKPEVAGGWGVRKFNLDDLYIRFFRVAERRIAEATGKGIVCFISNFSYLGDSSFVAMRKRFLDEFDALWFDCMNGDSRETGKVTPDGKPDPSVFSTEYSPVGIRVGTAIGLMVRREERSETPLVGYRDFWGATKRADLLASLEEGSVNSSYRPVAPSRENRFSFRPSDVGAHYLRWPRLTDLCAVPPSNGLMEKRGGALIDIDRDHLEQRMRKYYDPKVDWAELEALKTGLTSDAAAYDAKKTRNKVLVAEGYQQQRLRRYALRPYDHRWCYYSGVQPLWNRPRPTLWAQCWEGNAFLISRVGKSKDPEGPPFYFATMLSDDHLLAPDASCFPFYLKTLMTKGAEGDHGELYGRQGEATRPTANLSLAARDYLKVLGTADPDRDPKTAALPWRHALAIGYSPAYLSENADGVGQDWPRIPLPASREVLEASAALGKRIAALLDVEQPVKGVTFGTIGPLLRLIATISRVGPGELAPEAGHLDLTAGWGHKGGDGAVMPGRGKAVEREYTAEELEAIEADGSVLGISADRMVELLGATTFDVFLNGVAYWRNIPANVWSCVIGGYQVIKKWLSYREREILGRGLTSEEAREVSNMARRIAALRLLEPELNANYEFIKVASYAWPDPR